MHLTEKLTCVPKGVMTRLTKIGITCVNIHLKEIAIIYLKGSVAFLRELLYEKLIS